MVNLYETAKHTLTMEVGLYEALRQSAKKKGLDPHELLVRLVYERTKNDGTLPQEMQHRYELAQKLIAEVVEAALKRCKEGKRDEHIIRDSIADCTDRKEWLHRYEEYIGGPAHKHGNPLKVINREFGFRIRAAVNGVVKKDGNGKPIMNKVNGAIIQSYTLLEP